MALGRASAGPQAVHNRALRPPAPTPHGSIFGSRAARPGRRRRAVGVDRRRLALADPPPKNARAARHVKPPEPLPFAVECGGTSGCHKHQGDSMRRSVVAVLWLFGVFLLLHPPSADAGNRTSAHASTRTHSSGHAAAASSRTHSEKHA